MEYYRNPNAPTAGLIVRDVGLLILRLGAGLTLGFFHGWQHLMRGWQHLWYKQPWNLVDLLKEWGLPFPVVLATAAGLIFGLCSVGIFLGLLSRFSALLLLICALVGAFFSLFQPEAEMLWLYATVYVVLLFCGPGCFSLDHVLNRRRKS